MGRYVLVFSKDSEQRDHSTLEPLKYLSSYNIPTSNNQKLGSSGEIQASGQRSKCSCPNAGALRKFHVLEDHKVIMLRSIHFIHS